MISCKIQIQFDNNWQSSATREQSSLFNDGQLTDSLLPLILTGLKSNGLLAPLIVTFSTVKCHMPNAED